MLKNKLLLIVVVLIFLFFSVWDVSNYLVYKKYNKVLGTNAELEKVKNMIENNQPKEQIISSINKISDQIGFEHSICFRGDKV